MSVFNTYTGTAWATTSNNHDEDEPGNAIIDPNPEGLTLEGYTLQKAASRLEAFLYKSEAQVMANVASEKEAKPNKARKTAEFESLLIQYLNRDVMSTPASYILYAHGMIDPVNNLLVDMTRSAGSNQRHVIKLMRTYTNPNPEEMGSKNLVILDGVLEFLPNTLAQAMVLKNMLYFISNGSRGYLIIRNYAPTLLEANKTVWKLEPKDDGYFINNIKEGKSFLRGLTKKDIQNIIGFGRVGAIIDARIPGIDNSMPGADCYTFIGNKQ